MNPTCLPADLRRGDRVANVSSPVEAAHATLDGKVVVVFQHAWAKPLVWDANVPVALAW